jgi:hypothetical protein
MSKRSLQIKKICLAGLFLVLGWLLPIVTGRIPSIGNMLCPMHIPVLLCGFILGPWYGLLIGFITPITRFLIFGMPALYPSALCMMFELATYGLVSGTIVKILNDRFKINYLISIILSLLFAMIMGRIVWAIARFTCGLFDQNSFTWKMFLAGGFINAWPGILIQLIFIPILLQILNHLNVLSRLKEN